MKKIIINKIKNIHVVLLSLLICSMLTTSCDSGLVYDDVPEEYYKDVDLTVCNISSRYLFEDCIYAKNYKKYTTYIAQTTFKSTLKWINKTGSNYTLTNDSVVKPGDTITIKNGVNNITTRKDSNAPDGKVYVVNYYITPEVTYSTPNKGFLFDSAKIPSGFTLVNGTDGKATKVKTKTNLKQLVVAIQARQSRGDACLYEPQKDAPRLGIPGDFSKPRQYMVYNNMRRPDGVPQAKRLYEINIIVLP